MEFKEFPVLRGLSCRTGSGTDGVVEGYVGNDW